MFATFLLQQERCHAFQAVALLSTPNCQHSQLASASNSKQDAALSSDKVLDKITARQFTIQVCTSSNCCKKMNELGLDKYHNLAELYEMARIESIETDLIVEDGGCRGGVNCKLGPCVAVLHEDFVGSVALDGMDQKEFNERVFHGISTPDDVERVWSCISNAINLMTGKANQ